MRKKLIKGKLELRIMANRLYFLLISSPKDGQLLIRVTATALNRADLLQVNHKILLVFVPWINWISLMAYCNWQKRGLYPPPGESEILGLEASGVIADIGPGVKGKWKLGSKVMALLGGGGYAEYVAVPEEHVMPVPSPLTLYQAEAWLTAYQLLHFIGYMMSACFVFYFPFKYDFLTKSEN